MTEFWNQKQLPEPLIVPNHDNPRSLEIGKFGFSLFLVSLGVFFAASIVSYLVVRVRADVWPPEGAPGLPAALLISTIVILLTSVSIQWAVHAVKKKQNQQLMKALYVTTGLSILFLVLQGFNWLTLVKRELIISDSLYAFTFYLLTGLHALHVIGGVVPLFVIMRKANHELYTSYHYNGIYYCAMYWHFLDAVWIVLYCTLLLGS